MNRLSFYEKQKLITEKGKDQIAKIFLLFPRWYIYLYALFTVYLVLPIWDVPLLGLSISAPIFFFLAVHAMIKPPHPWLKKYEKWFFIAAFLWVGIASSFFVNEIVGSSISFNLSGLKILLHYAYWMLVFVIVIYLNSYQQILKLTINLLSWSVVIVAILRWSEALFFSRIGAWSGTQLFTQNIYGFLFSAFSPFAYKGILEKNSKIRGLRIIGVILIWSAAAINGSRGSWVSMVVGLALLLLFLLISKPKKFSGMVIAIIAIASLTGLVFLNNPAFEQVFSERFETLESLEEDKSYMSRQFLNQKSLFLFKESPLFGIGPSRYREASVMIDLPYVLRGSSVARLNQKTAHNTYLGVLAENGLAGAVPLILLLLYLSIEGGISTVKNLKQNQFSALYVFIAFIQMSAHFWVLAGLTGTSTWFIYGLVGGMIMLVKRESSVN